MDAKSSKRDKNNGAGSATATNAAAGAPIPAAADDAPARKTRKKSLVTFPLFMGALLPFAFSMYFHTHPPVAQSVEKGMNRPPLVFGQYMVNKGLVPPGSKIETAWFAFMNKGTEPITLKAPVASCECVNPRYLDDKLIDEKTVYRPGEKGRVYVSLDTTKESEGEKEFSITVPYESGTRADAVELTFRIALPKPQVAVVPQSLLFYQLNREEQTQKVEIIDNRAKPLEVLGIEHKSPEAVPLARWKLEGTEDRDGVRTITISVHVAGNVPERRIIESLYVKTNDTEYGTLRIPVMIDGRKISFSHPRSEAASTGDKESTNHE